MSGLLFLTSDDFEIQRGQKGAIMCNDIPGFSLILFYSTHCQYCKPLVTIFKQLPGTIGGCQFGMINVSANKKCVQMSRQTIAPVSYVPYIVLYINGKPFMIYKSTSPYDANEIRRFVIEVANNVRKKQQFSKKYVKEDSKSIPAYCLGVPIKGDEDVCYLEFDTAYPGKARR